MLPLVENEHVIIHESARPLVTAADFERIIAHEHPDVSYMLEIPFTVAPVDPTTAPGHRLAGPRHAAQRPAAAEVREVDAGRRARVREPEGVAFTEDATLCAVAGFDVRFIEGTDRNFKVTTRVDVQLAGYLLGNEANDE